MEDGERDWEHLLPEMLQLIAKKLPPDISHFIRFRAVCKTWHSSVPVSAYRPKPPWILKSQNDEDRRSLHFYNWFMDDDTYELHTFIPPMYNGCLTRLCCDHFYVLDCDHEHMYSLWNPITNKHIDLGWSDRHIEHHTIGPDPSRNGEYLILSIVDRYRPTSMLSFRRLAEPNNILFEIENISHLVYLYYNGEFFYLEAPTMITKVLDTATQKLAYEIPAPIDTTSVLDFEHLVESDGEILLLFKIRRGKNFDIYKLNLVNGKDHARWVKIDSIGNRVLFMDWHKCLSLSSDDCPTIGTNCIYFLFSRSIGLYDITDHLAYEATDPDFSEFMTWYIPSLC